MERLSIDIESYSETDLTKTGVYRYAEDPAFEVLLFCMAVDDGPITVYDLTAGEEIPTEIWYRHAPSYLVEITTRWKLYMTLFPKSWQSAFVPHLSLLPDTR